MYKIISKAVIYDFLGDDPEMIPQMMEMILTGQLPDLKALESLYGEGKLDEVKTRCHRGKSTMGYLGAMEVKQHLQEMENDVQGAFPDKNQQLQVYIAQIEKEVKHFLKEL